MKITGRLVQGEIDRKNSHLAHRGTDISRFFTNSGCMMGPIQRLNGDFTLPMLQELDTAAKA